MCPRREGDKRTWKKGGEKEDLSLNGERQLDEGEDKRGEGAERETGRRVKEWERG